MKILIIFTMFSIPTFFTNAEIYFSNKKIKDCLSLGNIEDNHIYSRI